MKYRSSFDEKIFFEEAKDVPISYLKNLDLASIIKLGGYIYFFFEGWKINKSRKSRVGYYVNISSRSPYRLMEEDVAYGTVWKYTSSKKRKHTRKHGEYCKVYRLWGTPYIIEMNTRGTYSDYKEDVDNKVFQLMIITDDDTIEIVNPKKIEWVKYNPKNMKNIITGLVQKYCN